MSFLRVQTCTNFLLLHCGLTHLKCYIASDVHLIMRALCETKQLKDFMNQKRKDIIFSSMFFLCIFFLAKNLFCYMF
jgi:hypothetical protein